MEGGCACGEIRYRFEGEVTEVSWCHCRNCQRIAGAPAAVYLTAPRAGFSIEKGRPSLGRVALTDFAERIFCTKCGSPLATLLDHQSDLVDITVASLDEPERFPPQFHIYHDSHIDWFETADELPRYPRGSRE